MDGYIEFCRLGGEETSVSTKQDYGATCNVLCNSGYTAQGATSRSCLADEGWDGIAQSCIGEDYLVVSLRMIYGVSCMMYEFVNGVSFMFFIFWLNVPNRCREEHICPNLKV